MKHPSVLQIPLFPMNKKIKAGFLADITYTCINKYTSALPLRGHYAYTNALALKISLAPIFFSMIPQNGLSYICGKYTII